MNRYLDKKETERLFIRPLTLGDIELWTPFFTHPNSIKYFPKFLSGNPEIDATSWIQKQLDRYTDGRHGLMALIEKSTGDFVGQCGLLTQEIDGKTEIEIGYSLLPQFEGKGYATEAAQLFKKYAFEKNTIDSVVSIIDIGNIPSQNVAMRNGMTKGKMVKDYFGIDVFIFRTNKENK